MIYVILGPTASGKTSAANCLANFLDAPIINGDAFQIYKDMNIGTNKIEKSDPSYRRYMLLDIVSPEETYSVKQYQTDFRNIDINKYPNIVVCGGTGLYIRAALYDYVFPESETQDELFEDKSNEELYSLLKTLDPKTSETIHVNNRKRVVRAINLINQSGKSKSTIIEEQKHKLIYDNVRFLFINPDRETLYELINRRVDEMFDNGLVNEVKNLNNKYKLSATAKQGIGYKEVLDYLSGIISLEESKELIKKRTRNYAKRQITFFKHQFDCEVFLSSKELVEKITHE